MQCAYHDLRMLTKSGVEQQIVIDEGCGFRNDVPRPRIVGLRLALWDSCGLAARSTSGSLRHGQGKRRCDGRPKGRNCRSGVSHVKGDLMLNPSVSSSTEICPGCGGHFPAMTGARHEYLAASVGCWAGFGRILERQYSDFRYATAHQLFTDAYCFQHSSGGDRRARRSALVHLAALYAQVELGWSGEQAVLLRQRLSKAVTDLPIGPRALRGRSPSTVSLVSAEAHERSVDAYAVSVFAAWSDQHDLAARLCIGKSA